MPVEFHCSGDQLHPGDQGAVGQGQAERPGRRDLRRLRDHDLVGMSALGGAEVGLVELLEEVLKRLCPR